MITTKQPTDDMIEVAIVVDGGGAAGRRRAVPDSTDRSSATRCAWRRRGATRDVAGQPRRAEPPRRDPRPAVPGLTRRASDGSTSDLDAKLAEVARQYDALQAELARPEVAADPDAAPPARPGAGAAGAGRRGLPRSCDAIRERAGRRARAARRRARRGDARDGARGDRPAWRPREARAASRSCKVLLLPRDPNDDRDVILEIRAGTGGEEAALFAAELFRMYLRYAERHRFKAEVLSLNETGIGGIKEAIVEIARRRRLQPPQVRGRRASRPARPGDRVAPAGSTPRPRPSPSCPRPTRSRSRSTRTGTSGSTSSARGAGRPVRQHHRLRGADHPPADRPGGRDPGREEPAQEQGQGDGGAALAPARDGSSRSSASAEAPTRRAMVGLRRPLREDPDLQLPAGPRHRPPHRPDLHNLPGVLEGDLDRLIDALIMTRPGATGWHTVTRRPRRPDERCDDD